MGSLSWTAEEQCKRRAIFAGQESGGMRESRGGQAKKTGKLPEAAKHIATSKKDIIGN